MTVKQADQDILDLELGDACGDGDIALVKKLVAAGANPACPNYYITASAAENGHLEILKWLVLESGRKTDLRASEEAIRLAILRGRLDVFLWILFESNENFSFAEFETFIGWAQKYQQPKILDWFFLESPLSRVFRVRPEYAELTQKYVNSGEDAICKLYEALPNIILDPISTALHDLQVKRTRLKEQLQQLQRDIAEVDAQYAATESLYQTELLTAFLTTGDRLQTALSSPVCRNTARAGLLDSVEKLENLLNTSGTKTAAQKLL